MPQTRFVTRKALELGLRQIVVVKKVDRPGARPDYAINATFDLFDKLGATDEQLDFPIIYASGLSGYAGLTEDVREGDMRPLFDAILQHVPQREDDVNAPLQLQICSLDYSSYVGKIGVGRVNRGRVRAAQDVVVKFGPDGEVIKGRINQVLKFKGLERVSVDEAEAGDIVLINGIEELGIGCTVTDPAHPEALPLLRIDEPTLTMNFMVNTSPLAGREGKFVTSRQLRDR
ncbi:translational GTPase TypA, partial [Providencia rettgeri]|nr:translational GTPase TypA [Providencia rettgeri]